MIWSSFLLWNLLNRWKKLRQLTFHRSSSFHLLYNSHLRNIHSYSKSIRSRCGKSNYLRSLHPEIAFCSFRHHWNIFTQNFKQKEIQEEMWWWSIRMNERCLTSEAWRDQVKWKWKQFQIADVFLILVFPRFRFHFLDRNCMPGFWVQQPFKLINSPFATNNIPSSIN